MVKRGTQTANLWIAGPLLYQFSDADLNNLRKLNFENFTWSFKNKMLFHDVDIPKQKLEKG